MNPTVLETLQTYRAAQNPVNASVPQNFHQISTSGGFESVASGKNRPTGRLAQLCVGHHRGRAALQGRVKHSKRRALAPEGHNRAQQYGLPPRERNQNSQAFSGQARTEDRKLKKELFGGPCLEGTLQKPHPQLVIPNEVRNLGVPNPVPWPGQLERSLLLKPRS